jgi:hypothetical protein
MSTKYIVNNASGQTISEINSTTISATTFYGDGTNLLGIPKYYAENSTPPNVSPIATGNRGIAIGDGAESNSNDVISFGTRSGSGATDNAQGIYLGTDSGANSVTSSNSIFLGENAGRSSSNSHDSFFVGFNSGRGSIGGNNSSYIGTSAGENSSGSDYSVFIGRESGLGSIDSYLSVFIGTSAGFSGQNNQNCVFIGNECALESNNNFNSIFIGDNSGQSSETCGGSIFLGNSSGRGQSGATFSIFLGQNSGNAQGGKYLGNNNIIIGNYVMLPTGSTNSLNIGNVIYGKNIYDFTLNGETTFSAQTEGKIGIGVVDPTARLHLGKSTTLSALMRLEVGPAPTVPNDGDIWLESNTLTGLKIRISGVTRTITIS